MDRHITRRQKEFLDIVERRTRLDGITPLLSEVAHEMRIAKPTAYMHAQELVRKGHLDYLGRGRSRTYILPVTAWGA